MTGTHDVFDELAAVYAAGALDGDDLVRFESHLAEGCEHCRLALLDSREALTRMALAGPPAAPPADVKAALLARVTAQESRPARRPPGRASWVPWAAATAAVAAVAAMLSGGMVASRYEARLGQMARETAAVRERLQRNEAALREQVAAYRDTVELLRDPATRVIELRGAGPSPEARARLVWHDAAGGHLIVANLPPAPAGKAYELWTLGGPAPRPAGVFQVDASGRATHRVEPALGPATRFAVTLEPEAGAPAPTGPIVLASR
ncbi:MAG TPA: anti-sigma factor [Methylomirabilota bacterium]|nr:anti-sigma factor [Methylomirabilota bacterium]